MNKERYETSGKACVMIDRVDEVYALSFTSPARNNYFSTKLNAFIEKIKNEYSDVAIKDIPALEHLRGGSEVAEPIDTEVQREVESELTIFLDQTERELTQI